MSPLERDALVDPRKVKSLPVEWEECITAIAAGECQTFMLSGPGRVYMCGCYKDKEGKMWRDQRPPDDPRVEHPIDNFRDIEAPEGSQDWPIHLYQMPGKAEETSRGASFNTAIVLMKRSGDDGQASGLQRSRVTWGLGESSEMARPVFKQLKKPGHNHCLALLDNGNAYTWGYVELNILGHGVERDEYRPRRFDPLIGIYRKRAKDGMMPLKAKIEIIDGEGQHSAVTICSSIA